MVSSEDESVHLDEVLKKFGGFSRYHIQAILLISFAFFNNGMHCINYVIVAEESPYRCKIEQCEQQIKVFESPYNFTTPHGSRGCYRYAPDAEGCYPSSFNRSIVEPCDEWVYEKEDSFVAEVVYCWNVSFSWRAKIGSVLSLARFIALALCAGYSFKDSFLISMTTIRIGRKAAIIISGLAAAVFGVAKSFATSYLSYIILEWFEATLGDNCSPAFILGIELVHSDYRLHQQIFFCVVAALGGVLFSVAAYIVPYWRHFVQVIYAPSLLFILYYFILDESVRWLLSKGKKEQATKLLLKISRINKTNLDEKLLVNIRCEDNGSNCALWATFRSKIVVKRFLICLIWWTSCTFISFGLVVNVGSLAGNKYLNIGIMSLSDIPASIAMVFILKRFKRKKPLLVSFVTAGLICLLHPLVPREYLWISTGVYFLGRFVSTFTFATVYIYTSELFPTYSRNSMHALCSAIGRIGSILAPMTPLLTRYMESLPTILFGSISIAAGLTTLLVPDLDNEPLPDNVEEAENIGSCPLNSLSHKSDSKDV